MRYKTKIFTLSGLFGFVLLGVAAVTLPQVKERNLKVLPKDISDQKLDSIMHSYNVALGVTCNFCHVPMKNNADSLDFALDDEPMKENARKMMRMVIDINKNNFYYDDKERPEYLNVVSCKTCHRGEAIPPE